MGVTPQGWLREWDAQGRISLMEWTTASEVLPRADVVVISIEDVAHDEALVQQWAAQARLLVDELATLSREARRRAPGADGPRAGQD